MSADENSKSAISNQQSAITLAFYTGPNCHLCDRLEAMLAPHLAMLGRFAAVTFTKRDITENESWYKAYWARVPVLAVDDRVLLEGRPELVDVAVAMAALAQQARSAPGAAVYLPPPGRPCILFERMHRDVATLASAQAAGAFRALAKALGSMTAAQAIDVIGQSGLRQRDAGAGPVAEQLQSGFGVEASGDRRVLCVTPVGRPPCPDLELARRDPHALLEGAMLAAWVCGAATVRIALPAENGGAGAALQHAVDEAQSAGIIGNTAPGNAAPGNAWRCAVELDVAAANIDTNTAAATGHAFETLCALPWIFEHGGRAYAKYGRDRSRGTKALCVSGAVKRPGLYEIEFGTTLRTLVFDLADGMAAGQRFKALRFDAEPESPFTEAMLDTPLDYEAITAAGACIGGGMVLVEADADASA